MCIYESDLPGKFKAWIYQHAIPPRVLWLLLIFAVPGTVKSSERKISNFLHKLLGLPCSLTSNAIGQLTSCSCSSLASLKNLRCVAPWKHYNTGTQGTARCEDGTEMEGGESGGGGSVPPETKGPGGHCGSRQSGLWLLSEASAQSGAWQGKTPSPPAGRVDNMGGGGCTAVQDHLVKHLAF